MRLQLYGILLLSMMLQSVDQQLLMFVHTQPTPLTDEEGLNIAYQALTAIRQNAAPILMSENIWQHVVLRSDRFKQGLRDVHSLQNDVVALHVDVNYLLKKHQGQIEFVNSSCNNAWFAQRYSNLKALDPDSYKHLLFDYFCYDIDNHFNGWKMYQLWGGYLLWIPNNQSAGFDIQNADRQLIGNIKKAVWKVAAADLDKVLPKYIVPDKNIHWTFYVTGHGYHKDAENRQARVAGVTLQSFHELLVFFDKECSTKLFVYNSCYGAGQHAVIPYEDEYGDLLLSYPVILVSLTDAPVYVFGAPSGLKLPPYNSSNMLTSADEHKQKLQPFFLQDFNKFCLLARENRFDADLVKTISPYEQCSFNMCSIVKIENLPLIRSSHTAYFMPLDQSQVYCLMDNDAKSIEMQNKAALLLYTYKYDGIVQLEGNVPFFISMLPGDQVHCMGRLNAERIDLSYLIRKMFLSIDDIHEQNIYAFDTISCSISIPEISKDKIVSLHNVLIIPAGPWLPYFAGGVDTSCYVYAQIQKRFYNIVFDQNKQISFVQELQKNDVGLMQKFKNFLLQECTFGQHKSAQELLSGEYFKQFKKLQQDLLQQCLQEKICKKAD